MKGSVAGVDEEIGHLLGVAAFDWMPMTDVLLPRRSFIDSLQWKGLVTEETFKINSRTIKIAEKP